MSESVHTSSAAVLLEPKNVGVASEISLIYFIEAEMLHCFISTSGFWRPSRRHRTVSTLDPLCSASTKMPVWFWDSLV